MFKVICGIIRDTSKRCRGYLWAYNGQYRLGAITCICLKIGMMKYLWNFLLSLLLSSRRMSRCMDLLLCLCIMYWFIFVPSVGWMLNKEIYCNMGHVYHNMQQVYRLTHCTELLDINFPTLDISSETPWRHCMTWVNCGPRIPTILLGTVNANVIAG